MISLQTDILVRDLAKKVMVNLMGSMSANKMNMALHSTFLICDVLYEYIIFAITSIIPVSLHYASHMQVA